MPLRFHPQLGTVLLCDYSTGFILPEMVKRRPVVVVSPPFKRRTGVCTVVPLSTTPPLPIEKWHVLLPIEPPLPKPFHRSPVWVKADRSAAVSFERLDLPQAGRDASGNATLTPMSCPNAT
jgi:mRNA interferase MazF